MVWRMWEWSVPFHRMFHQWSLFIGFGCSSVVHPAPETVRLWMIWRRLKKDERFSSNLRGKKGEVQITKSPNHQIMFLVWNLVQGPVRVLVPERGLHTCDLKGWSMSRENKRRIRLTTKTRKWKKRIKREEREANQDGARDVYFCLVSLYSPFSPFAFSFPSLHVFFFGPGGFITPFLLPFRLFQPFWPLIPPFASLLA
jgi:hypothetical protein